MSWPVLLLGKLANLFHMFCVFVLSIDCDPVPCSSVWNLFCAELFYLGRALLRGCEYMYNLTLLSHLMLIYTHIFTLKCDGARTGCKISLLF